MTQSETLSLQQLIGQFAPKNILVFGPVGEDIFGEYLQQHQDTRLEVIAQQEDASQLAALGKYDLVFVSHTLEFMDKTQALAVIASLRDIHSQRLLLAIPMGEQWTTHRSHWQDNELLGLGFVRLIKSDSQTRPIHIYGFDIATYKTTPSWLNSRYWAHPEMFDKHWQR